MNQSPSPHQNSNDPIISKEPRWPASIALLVAIALYVVLPQTLIYGPRYLIPALEIVLIVPLTIFNPFREHHETKALRYLAISLIALVNFANITSVILLVQRLLDASKISGRSLVYSAVAIWLTNAIVFGLWFWELDRGGPAKRAVHHEAVPDFLFPQMTDPQFAKPNWRPTLIDYVYVAFTNATAFSPTDTMPLTSFAKMLMTGESIVSMITVIVVAARAINILP
ncbi:MULTISPECIES: hypothetical protein [Acidithrix]|uniref:DUF1345 domain-containing protein n=1 Tax=Acidithrix ferrooxidans TaxID=1280514 RepID=A0A0D8HGB0_9ACTN|nr:MULTISPECIES: hypothetical protein [Acidithrix]KJF17020.1 hypothetical protein AXFE_21550 [Acidithrix ferrooxidans]